jgi:COX assembly protein 1
MNTLSRREEDTLLKATKARALKDCDSVVKGTQFPDFSCKRMTANKEMGIVEFADCASGRTISVAWACQQHHKRVQECMRQ